MDLYEVSLPALDWFAAGNVFSGSLGTDPAEGCLNKTTLNYKVRADLSRGMLQVVCHMQLPILEKSNIQEYRMALFELSDFGREIAENWIRNQWFEPYRTPAGLSGPHPVRQLAAP